MLFDPIVYILPCQILSQAWWGFFTAFVKSNGGVLWRSPHVKSLRFWACPPLLVGELRLLEMETLKISHSVDQVLQLKRFHTRSGAAYKLFNEVWLMGSGA